MTASIRALVFAACAATAVAPAGRAADGALPKDSPFMPAGPGAAAAVSAGEAYELAAVSTIGKKTTVNIFDRQAKKGKWIAIGETADGIAALNYDAAREQAVVRIGGVEKTLTLRKAAGTAPSPLALGVAPLPAGFNLPAPVPVAVAPVASGTDPAATATPAAAPAAKPEPPPAPGSVAHQEQEARMLVSDLLEIGMAQRKAYEEAQKKAAQPAGQTSAESAPAARTPGS